jgi:hypothetical protein
LGSYLTDHNPTVEQWLGHNEPFFDWLRSGRSGEPPATGFAVLVDFDEHAERADRDMHNWFDELVASIGDLGLVRLTLSHSEMDDATHIILELKRA